jgi:hypothetical protein
MNIETIEQCADAKQVFLKGLSAIGARERELHWIAELQNLDSRYRPLTISARIDIAHEKTSIELEEFRMLKEFMEMKSEEV